MSLLIAIDRPRPGIFARAADVEDEDVVASGGQLGGKMVVGDRPERGVEPQAVTENHRQLARVGMPGPIVPHPQPPAILGVGITVGARPQIGAGRIAAHGGAAHQQKIDPRTESP